MQVAREVVDAALQLVEVHEVHRQVKLVQELARVQALYLLATRGNGEKPAGFRTGRRETSARGGEGVGDGSVESRGTKPNQRTVGPTFTIEMDGGLG